MAGRPEAAAVPAAFRDAVASVRAASLRPEVVLEEAPAPQRLASYTLALTADVVIGGEELAGGRFVLLHEPGGQDAWGGEFRAVTFVRAELELEMAADPLLPGVGWTWLTEALDAHGATYTAPGGTVTRVASESFGGLAGKAASAQVELRASWTPLSDLGGHLEAWADLLCTTAGLPPVPPGVTTLRNRRGVRAG